jgi:hypothetical protein
MDGCDNKRPFKWMDRWQDGLVNVRLILGIQSSILNNRLNNGYPSRQKIPPRTASLVTRFD